MPRGALFGDTLDLLDPVGIDTAALRSDSRSLLFPGERVTIVTMRPSDVPTYVEAGAVDLGITGKDVLMEQHGARRLRAARPRTTATAGWWSPRAPAITSPTTSSAAWAPSASRPSTRGSRRDYFEASGRQAEVIEVKGSVELAPISGLADGIVDLTASGRTLRDNDLEVREVIADCTARLVANRVSHKLRQDEIDDLVRRIGERVDAG